MARTPPPENPTDSVTFNQFSGIKNTVSRERLAPGELEVAKNVDLDNMGQLRRRRGFTRVALGDFHSLFRAADDTVYGVKDGSLGIIYPNFTFQSLASGAGDAPIAYVQVADTIYYSSEDVSGKIDAKTHAVSAWGASTSDTTWLSPVVNPVEGLPPIKGKMLGKPPMATALAYYNGRIYLANDRTVWATELYLYDYVDKTKNYMMYESKVTMLAAVTDGLYVGTNTGIWFQSGPFNEMRRVLADGGAALPGSAVPVGTGQLPELQINSRSAYLVMTPDGLVVLLDSGNTINLTENKVIFPEATRVNSLFRMQDGVNQYIGVANSAGTPSSNARIGDYVDAEIRRFQGA